MLRYILVLLLVSGFLSLGNLPVAGLKMNDAICADKSNKKVIKTQNSNKIKKSASKKKKVVQKKKTKKKSKKNIKRSSKKKKAVKKSSKPKKKITNYNTFKGDDYYNVELVKKAVAKDWKGAQQMLGKTKNKSFGKTVYNISQIYYQPERMRLSEINSFFDKNSWLPAEPFLRGVENNIDFSRASQEEILYWFEAHTPVTDNGRFIQLDAMLDNGDITLDDNRQLKKLRLIWRETSFNDVLEEKFLKKYKAHLEISDLLKKIEISTWEGRTSRASKLISLLPKKYISLPKERLELSKYRKPSIIRIKKSLNKYPDDLYFQFKYIRALQKSGKEKQAIDRLLKVKADANYAKWWKAKNIGIRDAIKMKMYPEAYKLTTDHRLPYGADMAEAEWLGGWISLRFLNNPKIASFHFETLYKETKFASSRSKASYWSARSYEAMGDYETAQSWYNKAAAYKGTFYGTMAIAQIMGKNRVNYFIGKNEAHGESWESFVDKEKAKMITHLTAILHEARVYKLVDKLFYSVADLDLHPKDLQIYVEMLEKWNKKPLAVKFTRVLSNRGAPLIRDGYPYKIDIMQGKVPKSVYLGIIRQESNFDQNAVSSAGARGLMQIMPATAKRVAKMFKLKSRDYAHNSKDNITHGVKYFDHLYGNYGSIPMSIAAYNAGPGNVKKWVKSYGDPRELNSTYQIIDWIESIPYSETRNYVKSVLENSTIYDSILSKEHKPERLLGFISQ